MTGNNDAKRSGRPSSFSQELADYICGELASGKSMRSLCRTEDMPAMSTIFKWLRENPEFSEQYARAKAEAADALVEENLDIADDPETIGWRHTIETETL